MPKAELTEAHCDADLNARSVLTASRQAMPWLKRQGGFIVNTSSIAARNGAGGGAGLYGSARLHPRHGQGTDRLASTRWPPGTIATPFHERYPTEEQAMVATIPQGRAGTPQDCVGAFPLVGPVERLHHRPRGERWPVDAVSGGLHTCRSKQRRNRQCMV
nr:hypothetical protein [Mesorhizobium sp.]